MKLNLLERQNFLVFGAARSGLAAAQLLKQSGKTVAVYDEAAPEKLGEARRQMEALGVPLLTRESAPEVPGEWQVLVISPGIPPAHPLARRAEQGGCLVRSEIEIGFHFCPVPVIAITGTNGKTTVTHLTAHLFEQSGRPAILAGNVGRALCDAVLDERIRMPGAVVVCEVSSYQLETIETFHPKASTVLNVTPDHLSRYATMDDYADAKLRIARNQGADEALVLNAECPFCRKFPGRTRAGVWWFSAKRAVERGAYLRGDTLVFVDAPGAAAQPIMERREIPLPGLHNVENVLAALTLAAGMGLDPAALRPHVRSFQAVPHRIEPVGEIDGVRYFNDSKATNLDSLEKALESFEEPIVLIAGGRDKGAPWTQLNDLVARRVRALVLIGEAAPIGRAAWSGLVSHTVDAVDMDDAIDQARALAAVGDVVLLSPACASFDMYSNSEG